MTHSKLCTIVCFALSFSGTAVLAQTAAQNDSSARSAARSNTLPLIPTRTLKFTTTEGTWISLDLAPGGQTIVFDLLGDLYTLPVNGGTATRITSGAAYDQQPRYSPDGKQIVFVSDRNGAKNLWIANADGSRPHLLTKNDRQNFSSPIWTPDGQYVIAARGGQLWMYHKDGGSGLQMTGQRPEGVAATAPPPPPHLGPAFGNDPRYLWVNVSGPVNGGFVAATPVDPEVGGDDRDPGARSTARQEGLYQIAQLERATGRTFVRTAELEGAFRPMPSPDGRWLVYATRYDAREGLKLRDLTTGEDRWLIMDVQRDNSQGGGATDRDVYPGSAWTPDSHALITSFNGKIWRVEVPSGRIAAIPFSAEVEQQLGPLAKFEYPINDSILTVTQIRGATPSPNGRQIAFSALDRLWVAELGSAGAGSGGQKIVIRGARRLTASSDVVEHAPVWSPDGRYVAYVTWNDSLGGDIYRVAADGAAPARPDRLTRQSAFYDKLAYSADGTKLMGVRGSRSHRTRTLEDFGTHGGSAELEYIWLPAQGGEATRITWVGNGATEQGRNVPHVGPDSSRLYVWEGADGLVSMRFDGTDRKLIMKVTGPPPPTTGAAGPPPPPPPPDEVLLSPDGTRALVRAERNVYLVTVPPVAGQAATVSVTSGSVVPTTRITRIGGDFVGWQRDGRAAYYSIGRSFFRYDLGVADSLMRDSVARADANAGAAQQTDTSRRMAPAYDAQRYDVEITALKDKPVGMVALRGARIITMKGDEVITNGDIVVKDNRIVGIGPRGSVSIPAGARTLDMGGKTIMPGYVDIHAHTWIAWGLHRAQVSQFLAQLAYGVTTQRDPQTSSDDVLTYTDLMETGALIGPRLYSTGRGIFSTDNIKSLDDARDVLRRYSDHFNTQTIKQYLAGDRKVRQWVIMAARELGLTTTTEGGSNFTMNLTLMQDGYAGLEHSLPIDPLEKDVVQLQAFSGITYTPTLIVSYGGPWGRQYWLTHYDLDGDRKLHFFTPHDELDKWKNTDFHSDDQYVFTSHAAQLKKMVEAGGRVGLGSHGEVQGIGVHWELWMLGSGGMKPHDVLRAATLHGADAIGLSHDIGSLEVGKLADLQILEKNPLDDLKNSTSITHVMKNGRLYEAGTLTEVWPRTKALPSQWWWRVDAPAPSSALPAARPK